MNELKIQAELVKAIKVVGGFGFKLQNHFLSGICDLLLIHPDTGPVFIETKMASKSGLVLLTPLQRETLKRMRQAGANVGVVVIEKIGKGEYYLHVTTDLNAVRLGGMFIKHIKAPGGMWPITGVMFNCLRIRGPEEIEDHE